MLSDEFAKIKNDIYQEGKQEGKLEGRLEGKLSGLYNLVRRGRLTSADAAEEADMPLSVFMEKMAEYNAGARA